MIRAGLADGLARVRGVRVAEFDPRMPADDVLTLAAAELRAVISDDPGTPPCAIGVAAPGAVDGSGRVNTLAVNLGWRDIPVADLLGGVPTLRLSGKLEDRVRSGQHLRKGDLDALEAGVPDAFKEGDSMVLEDPSGACVVAVVRAACASASLVRRDPSSVVFEVQRILR